jgi:2-polyprenyl-6-methoxyphenol hydroxylase-like FAD-dependent oxidoreductase
MRVAVLGGGPGGLYFAARWKARHAADEVMVFEQNRADATFGFGVVFSDRAMDFLRRDDAAIADAVTRRMQTWSDMTIVHRGEPVTIDGIGFSAIGRLELLQLFQAAAAEAGVELRFGTAIAALAELAGFDLVVAADGVNSVARRELAPELGATLTQLDEKFAWFGTTKPFDTLTQTFVATPSGTFNAHHYRYAPGMSTFIVECDRATWQRSALDRMDEEASRRFCARVFATTLDGHALVANRSAWRSFPWVWNERWSAGNCVLIGDALHTAHYSIGSGTRLALEDAIALTAALEAHPGDLPAAFGAFEAARRPAVETLVRASKTSADWYARFPEHMRLDPLDLAYSYITRSGRVDHDRLRAMSPRFMARHDAAAQAVAP